MSNNYSRIDPVTRLRRLRRALIVIRSIDPKNFYMDQWMEPLTYQEADAFYAAKTSQERAALSKKIAACGTVGCALGWCGRDPVLRQEGLECSVVGDFRVQHRKVRSEYDQNTFRSTTAGEAAAIKFFGISQDEAAHLFMPGSYGDRTVTPNMVARRLETVINRYERETLVGS